MSQYCIRCRDRESILTQEDFNTIFPWWWMMRLSSQSTSTLRNISEMRNWSTLRWEEHTIWRFCNQFCLFLGLQESSTFQWLYLNHSTTFCRQYLFLIFWRVFSSSFTESLFIILAIAIYFHLIFSSIPSAVFVIPKFKIGLDNCLFSGFFLSPSRLFHRPLEQIWWHG